MNWSGGLAEWIEDDTAYLSVAFTWRLPEAKRRAESFRNLGLRVRVGGPAVFLRQKYLSEVADIGGSVDAIVRHNPNATIASRGCPVGCWFCIVPKMEGREFTLVPDFVPRPILCDNNLSALPADYQDYIIRRYQEHAVPLLDANSGFEPRTFTPDVYRRWHPMINAGRGPWRFAYDEMGERRECLRVMEMLKDEPQKRKRVYVLIGNEPITECMQRIQEVIDHGCEPHVQPLMKLNALDREPWVRYDWTARKLKDVARWANRWLWKQMPFSEYGGSIKRRDEQSERLFA